MSFRLVISHRLEIDASELARECPYIYMKDGGPTFRGTGPAMAEWVSHNMLNGNDLRLGCQGVAGFGRVAH